MIKFKRESFHPRNKIINSHEIQQLLDDLFLKKFELDSFKINDISSKKNILNNSVLFLDKSSENKFYNNNNLLIITNNLEIFDSKLNQNLILVNNLSKSYNLIVNNLFFHDDSIDFNDDYDLVNNSLISKYAKIDSSSKILGNCVIGRGVKIGKKCIIKNNVVIKNTIISDNVIICDNSTIGSTGFGFEINNLGSSNISPQIGIVFIGNNVHIGANCSIDRGKIDATYIGENSMIDNLVHIAHNVYIERNACIAAQSGISGSVSIGKNLISGGQSGYAGHINIGDNVIVAAKSGVTKNIKDNSKVAGFPAINIYDWKKNIIKNKK